MARVPLRYAAGADPALDRPAHVRAASALVRVGRGHLIVQDDALFLGALAGGEVEAVALPSPDGVRQFEDARGNKAAKPDLEAACTWPGPAGAPALVAFGSGSTAARERVLIAPEGDARRARLVDAAALFALVRAAIPEGAEVNVEGALRLPNGDLRLLQRGNGRGAFDATLDVGGAWLDALVRGRSIRPRLVRATRWQLGELGGVRLTFTDGVGVAGGSWLFSASAEASPDATGDGPVSGSAVGWADDRGAAWAPLVGDGDRVLGCKLEGLALSRPGELWGVEDADDPSAPSALLHLRLEGPWPR